MKQILSCRYKKLWKLLNKLLATFWLIVNKVNLQVCFYGNHGLARRPSQLLTSFQNRRYHSQKGTGTYLWNWLLVYFSFAKRNAINLVVGIVHNNFNSGIIKLILKYVVGELLLLLEFRQFYSLKNHLFHLHSRCFDS